VIRYFGQLAVSMSRHLEEAALALLIAVTVGILYAGAGWDIPVLQLVLAIAVLQFGLASWRLHRRQQVLVATTRDKA